MKLPRFTLVGATARTELLTSPLRDRLGIDAAPRLLRPREPAEIVERSADRMRVRIHR